MGWLSSLRGGNWLLGVYKGSLITASDDERDDIWMYTYKIRSKGIFHTADKRQRLAPYFFILEPVSDNNVLMIRKKGSNGRIKKSVAHEFLGKFGLESLAYEHSGTEPVPAYGHVKKDCFILDETLVSEYKKNNGIRLAERMEGSTCVLALKMESGIVRTGTFFKSRVKDGKIVLEPCKIPEGESAYLVGKGVLLGMAKDDSRKGGMEETQSKYEMECRVSRLSVGFYDPVYTKDIFSIVYRVVSTDLRADLPLALLKVSQADETAFERMFQQLGASVREEFGKRIVVPWNLQIDGNPVDFGDFEYVPFPTRRLKIEEELCRIMLSAALISVAGKKALLAMAGSDAEVKKLAQEDKGVIQERYELFFGKFSEGAGKVTEVFEAVGKRENKYLTYFFEHGRFPP